MFERTCWEILRSIKSMRVSGVGVCEISPFELPLFLEDYWICAENMGVYQKSSALLPSETSLCMLKMGFQG